MHQAKYYGKQPMLHDEPIHVDSTDEDLEMLENLIVNVHSNLNEFEKAPERKRRAAMSCIANLSIVLLMTILITLILTYKYRNVRTRDLFIRSISNSSTLLVEYLP